MFTFMPLLEEAGGPNTELSWLLWIALGFFAVMVLVGWLSSRFGWKKEPAAPAAHGEESHGH